MRLLTLGGVAGPILFSVVVIVSATLRADYSHIANFISELGATGTPYAGLMNYAGFLPGGLMLAAFGVALAKALPRRRATLLAAILVTLFGAGVAVSGIASCDPGCPQTGGSVENLIHNWIAPIAFLCLIAAAGILGILLSQRFGLAFFRRLFAHLQHCRPVPVGSARKFPRYARTYGALATPSARRVVSLVRRRWPASISTPCVAWPAV